MAPAAGQRTTKSHRLPRFAQRAYSPPTTRSRVSMIARHHADGTEQSRCSSAWSPHRCTLAIKCCLIVIKKKHVYQDIHKYIQVYQKDQTQKARRRYFTADRKSMSITPNSTLCTKPPFARRTTQRLAFHTKTEKEDHRARVKTK